MKLLTKELRNKFPKLYETEFKNPKEVRVIAKFFASWATWTWYATEFDGKDTFFGFVQGLENELGYFSLSELENLRHPVLGIPVERDLYFGDHTLADVMERQI